MLTPPFGQKKKARNKRKKRKLMAYKRQDVVKYLAFYCYISRKNDGYA